MLWIFFCVLDFFIFVFLDFTFTFSAARLWAVLLSWRLRPEKFWLRWWIHLNNHHLFLRLGGFDIELIAFLIFQISPWILTTILISYSSGSWELLWSLMMWPADPLLSLLLGGHLHRHVVLTWIQTSLTEKELRRRKLAFIPEVEAVWRGVM